MSIEEKIEKLINISTTILDSIKRLERIALAHTVDLEDLDARLTILESRLLERKPQ